jgi:hypothetical protein
MNIHTGAVYMKQGYRLRRPSWHETHHLVVSKYGDIEKTHLITSGRLVAGEVKTMTYEIHDSLLDLTVEDLLADDWEISESKNEKTS